MNKIDPLLADADAADPIRGQVEACARLRDPALAARRSRSLEDLAQIGVELARSVLVQIQAQAALTQAVLDCHRDNRPGAAAMAHLATAQMKSLAAGQAGGSDVGLIYDRIARAVRRCWALEEYLATAPLRPARPAAADRAAAPKPAIDKAKPADTAPAAKPPHSSRPVAQPVVEDLPGAERNAESLRSDLDESLDIVGEAEDLALDQPVETILGEICRDLGQDRRRWEDKIGAGDPVAAAVSAEPQGAVDEDDDFTDPAIGCSIEDQARTAIPVPASFRPEPSALYAAVAGCGPP